MDSKDFRTLNDSYRFVYEEKAESPEKEEEDRKKDDDLFAVSYTHLTLPTIYSV